MYKNPNQIISDGIITGIVHDSHIQPNAIDFSVDKLFKIDPSPFYLSNDKNRRVMRTLTPVQLTDSQSLGYLFSTLNPVIAEEKVAGWLLEPNSYYEGTSNMYVEVPKNIAAILVLKSTLNRNAMKLIAGLYDTGFKGNIGFTLHNPGGYSFIEVGALVGQIIFVDSESVGLYTGGYNTKNGQHWTEINTESDLISEAENVPITVTEFVSETNSSSEVLSLLDKLEGTKSSRKIKRK